MVCKDQVLSDWQARAALATRFDHVERSTNIRNSGELSNGWCAGGAEPCEQRAGVFFRRVCIGRGRCRMIESCARSRERSVLFPIIRSAEGATGFRILDESRMFLVGIIRGN